MVVVVRSSSNDTFDAGRLLRWCLPSAVCTIGFIPPHSGSAQSCGRLALVADIIEQFVEAAEEDSVIGLAGILP
jgi:hypothetical protein